MPEEIAQPVQVFEQGLRKIILRSRMEILSENARTLASKSHPFTIRNDVVKLRAITDFFDCSSENLLLLPVEGVKILCRDRTE